MPWVGRLAEFKMQIFSKILYILLTILIPLSSHYLTSLKSLLKTFLWRSSRARCALRHLIRHIRVGGLGPPDIDYYFQLAPICHWFHASQEILWLDIETTLTHSVKLYHLLLADSWASLNLKSIPMPPL